MGLPHNYCIIFLSPLGSGWECPAHNFYTLFSAKRHFLKSAAVQDRDVSMLVPRLAFPDMISGSSLSAPDHKSQIASDLKSWSPNRKNSPQIAVSAQIALSNRAICDLVRIAVPISYTTSQNNELF